MDESTVLRACLNEATYFHLTIKLGKLFPAETQRVVWKLMSSTQFAVEY